MRFRALLSLAVAAVGVHAEEASPLKLVQAIPLPGVKGRFDHFSLDAKGHRLFAAALGNDTLEVLDLAAGKRLKSITGLHKPTGVLYLAGPDQIGVAGGDDGTFKVFGGASYDLPKTLGSLDDADNMRFDAKANLIYLGYAAGALGLINAASLRPTGSIRLPAHPESFQLETSGPRIFVNVPDAKQIAVVDRERRAVIAHWPMEKFQANFPMALDESSHRLFVGCRQPARLVVFDTEPGTPVADLGISGDTDDLFYDAKRRRLYLACGEGFLDTVQRHDSDRYKRIARQPTRAGARTCFFSPELDGLYLAVPQRDGHDAEVRIYQPQ